MVMGFGGQMNILNKNSKLVLKHWLNDIKIILELLVWTLEIKLEKLMAWHLHGETKTPKLIGDKKHKKLEESFKILRLIGW